jgi:hypothetical protein
VFIIREVSGADSEIGTHLGTEVLGCDSEISTHLWIGTYLFSQGICQLIPLFERLCDLF